MRISQVIPTIILLALFLGASLAGLPAGGPEGGGDDGSGAEDNAGSRGSQSKDRDIAVIGAPDYQGVMEVWGSLGAAEVGRNTEFSVHVRNLGVQVDDVPVEFRVTDSLGAEEYSTVSVIDSLATGQDEFVGFSWKPLRSGIFDVEAVVGLDDDANPANDASSVEGLVAAAWSEDFEGGQLAGWELEGDPLWHITGKVRDDPEPGNHSSPNALYHGSGGTGTYSPGQNAVAKSPPIDLRRFDDVPNGYARLLVRYTGQGGDAASVFLESVSSDGNITKLFQITGDSSQGFWSSADKGGVVGVTLDDDLLGSMVRFQLRWTSGEDAEGDLPGFYIDDILIYGPEAEPFSKDVGVSDLRTDQTSPVHKAGVVGEPVKVQATVTNHGTETLTGVQAYLNVTDHAGEVYLTADDTRLPRDRLEPGQSWVPDWTFTPQHSGEYTFKVSSGTDNDQDKGNNVRETDLTVARYLADFEEGGGYGLSLDCGPAGADDAAASLWGGWTATGEWRLDEWEPGGFDPVTAGHSPSWVMTVSGPNGTVARGETSQLTSPLIDLQGINTGEDVDRFITASFRYTGSTGGADYLLYEYMLDESGIWEPVTGGTDDGIISGVFTKGWSGLDDMGSGDLAGHLVRFRLTYVAAPGPEDVDGLYIDDFMVGGLVEERHRPEVREVDVAPDVIHNDGAGIATVYVEVADEDGDVTGVTADLSALKGQTAMVLDATGRGAASRAGGGGITTYTGEFTVGSEVGAGEYLVRVNAIDADGRSGYGLAHVVVSANRQPAWDRYEPLATHLTINETEQVHFYALGSDADRLTYIWYVDGEEAASGPNNKSFTLDTMTDGPVSAGEHVVRVVVEDDGNPPLNVSREWNVTVVEVLADMAFETDGLRLSRSTAEEGANVSVSIRVRNLGLNRADNVTISLQQLGHQPELTYTFATVNVGVINPGATRVISVNWTAVMNITVIKATLDPDDVLAESNEANNVATATLKVVEEAADIVDDKPDDPIIRPPVDDPSITDSGDNPVAPVWTNAAVVGAATVILLFALLGMSEVGTYGLISLFIPLYSRIKGIKILRHNVRDRIYNYIRANPGVHYRHIMTELQMKNGTLVHHLMRLEQEELIRSEMDGLYKRFYPMGMKIPKSEAFQVYPSGTRTFNVGPHQLSEIQLRIVRYLWSNPGISQKEISDGVNESRRVVNYHMKLLETNGIVTMSREGRRMACYVPEGLFPEEDILQYTTGRAAPDAPPQTPVPKPSPAQPKVPVPKPAAPTPKPASSGGATNGMKDSNGLDGRSGPGADGFRDEKVEIDIPSGLPAVGKAPPVPRPKPAPKPMAPSGGIKTGSGGGIRTGSGAGIRTGDDGAADGGGIRTGEGSGKVALKPRAMVKKKE